jgi:hypothetical protein
MTGVTPRTKKKKKYTTVQRIAKKKAKTSVLDAAFTPAETSNVCTSCGEAGHTTSRNLRCRNHAFIINKILDGHFPNGHDRYTVSIPFQSFVRSQYLRDLQPHIRDVCQF